MLDMKFRNPKIRIPEHRQIRIFVPDHSNNHDTKSFRSRTVFLWFCCFSATATWTWQNKKKKNLKMSTASKEVGVPWVLVGTICFPRPSVDHAGGIGTERAGNIARGRSRSRVRAAEPLGGAIARNTPGGCPAPRRFAGTYCYDAVILLIRFFMRLRH